MNSKVNFIILLALLTISCGSDDETSTPMPESATFDFTLNGEDFSFDTYIVEDDPTISTERNVFVNFNDANDASRRIRFTKGKNLTGEMGQFVYTHGGVNYISDHSTGNRDTSITVHTDLQMKGTFSIVINDTFGNPIYTFTNGVFNLVY